MAESTPGGERASDAGPMVLPQALQQIPRLPRVLARALQIARDQDSRRVDLSRAVALDEVLTSRFLRTVNSAYYALPRRVTSLDEAIGYLGYRAVEGAILKLTTSDILAQSVPSYGLKRYMLWEHSVAVAEGTLWIAQRHALVPESDAYVAGLLHDSGKLVLDLANRRNPAAWGREGVDEAEPWPEVEGKVCGSDHAEVGGELMRAWGLSDRVVEAVAHHHTPGQSRLDRHLAAAVHLADAGALMAGVGVGVDGLRYPLAPEAVALLAWDEEDMGALVGRVMTAVERAQEFLRAAS